MPLMGVIIKKAIELRSKLPTDITRVDGFSAQTKVLRKLLRKAQFTYFGEHYNFFDLLKQDGLIKAFKESVGIF